MCRTRADTERSARDKQEILCATPVRIDESIIAPTPAETSPKRQGGTKGEKHGAKYYGVWHDGPNHSPKGLRKKKSTRYAGRPTIQHFLVNSRQPATATAPPPSFRPPPSQRGRRGGEGGVGEEERPGFSLVPSPFFFSLEGKSLLQRTAHRPNIAAIVSDAKPVKSIRH